MRRLLGFALAAFLFAPLTASAQDASGEHELRGALNRLIVLFKEERYAAVAEGVQKIRKQVEDSAEPRFLDVFFELMSISATKLGDKTLQLHGEFQNAILRMRAHGPVSPQAVNSDVALAITYDGLKSDQPLQIAGTNALGSLRLLKEQGQGSPDLDQQEAWARVMLGQSYQRVGRPELALHHFRLAKRLGDKGALDDEERATLTLVLDRLEPTISAGRPPHAAGACAASLVGGDKSKAEACLRRADLALLDGDQSLAETILGELIGDAQPNRLSAERLPAALALHLLLAQRLAPDDPRLVQSVLIVGHRLALDERAAAALLTVGTAEALARSGRFERDVADLCGHIARRAARGGNEDLALRFLDAQVATLALGLRAAEGDAGRRELLLEQTLVQLDAASFAELNGYDGLAARYRKAAAPGIDALAALPSGELHRFLLPYWNPGRGYVFPGAGAAAELEGRVAERSPGEPGSGQALLLWIWSELRFRTAEQSAMALADRLIARIRAAGDNPVLLSDLLAIRADLSDEPLVRSQLNREAYALIRDRPATEGKRVALLLGFAKDAGLVGDVDSALRFVDEARRVAGDNPLVNVGHRAQFEKWRALVALNEGDMPRAIEALENALRIVVAGTGDGDGLRVEPARELAQLYADQGRMAEARELYRKYVQVEAMDPLHSGESQALGARYSLVNLDAYYGPTPETLKELEKLFRLSGETAARDETLHRALIRAEAFARYGLGQGAGALMAGRRAFEMGRNHSTERAQTKEDRLLLETMVGAGLLATEQTEAPKQGK